MGKISHMIEIGRNMSCLLIILYHIITTINSQEVRTSNFIMPAVKSFIHKSQSFDCAKRCLEEGNSCGGVQVLESECNFVDCDASYNNVTFFRKWCLNMLNNKNTLSEITTFFESTTSYEPTTSYESTSAEGTTVTTCTSFCVSLINATNSSGRVLCNHINYIYMGRSCWFTNLLFPPSLIAKIYCNHW